MFLPLQMLSKEDAEQIMEADSLMKAKVSKHIDTFQKMTWEERLDTVWHDLQAAGFKLLVVLIIFILGRWLIRALSRGIDRILERRKVDIALRAFIRSMVKTVLYLILFYIIISYLGLNTTLFIALFTAAGLAVGMALSGVFQNFAGGVMIMLLKPFRAGDWIEVQGQAGTVIEIRLFNTILRTGDNKTIMLPNNNMSSSIINNYNTAHTRRLEWNISLEYGTDFEAVKVVLTELIMSEQRVMERPAPFIVLSNLGDSAINVMIRGWVKSADYWDVFYTMNARIYETLPERGFTFPFSQLDVNLHNIADPKKD